MEQISIKQTKRRLKISLNTCTSPDGFPTLLCLRASEKLDPRPQGEVGGAALPPTLYPHTPAGRCPLASPRCRLPGMPPSSARRGPSRVVRGYWVHRRHPPGAELHLGMLVVHHLLLFRNCRNQSPTTGHLRGAVCVLSFHANRPLRLQSGGPDTSSRRPRLGRGFPSLPAHRPPAIREVKPPKL